MPPAELSQTTSPRDKRAALLPLTSLRFVAAAMIVTHHGFGVNGLPGPLPRSTRGLCFSSSYPLHFDVWYPRLDNWTQVRRFLIYRVARISPAACRYHIRHHRHLRHADRFSRLTVQSGDGARLGAELALVFQLQRRVVEYFDRVLFLPDVSAIDCELEPHLLVEARTRRRSALGTDGRRPRSEIPHVTADDTPSLLGLLYISPLARILEFVAGMTTCLAFRWAAPKIGAASPSLFTVIEAAALAFAGWALVTQFFSVVMLRVLPSSAGDYLSHASEWPAIMPVIFIFAFQRGLLSQFLSLKPCLLFGEASYSLYLIHYYFGLNFISRYLGIIGVPGFIGGFATSLILAFALWRWVEVPARRAIRRLVPTPRFEPVPTRLATQRHDL